MNIEASSQQPAYDLPRLERLTTMLRSEPSNGALLEDASRLALSWGQYESVLELAAIGQQSSALSVRVQERVGLALIRTGRFEQAAKAFENIKQSPLPAEISYHWAGSLMMLSRYEDALSILAEQVALQYPPAAAARIRCLHHLGRLEEAMSFGAVSWNREQNDAVASTLALVALDLGLWPDAEKFASSAPDLPDCATALAFLSLRAGRPKEARTRLQSAVTSSPDHGRAILALGIADLMDRRYEAAAIACERSASLLKTHVGAWVAASWAYILCDRLVDASRCADEAIRIEPRFSEAQGVKAVLAIRAGNREDAERLAKRSLRLDPDGLSGIAARFMIQSFEGNTASASTIFERAVQQPLSDGLSIFDHMIALSQSR